MAEFFDYDELTGLRIDTDQQGDITVVHRSQDVSGLIEKARLERDQGLTDEGIKKGFWKVASIPPVVELQLMQKGIPLNKLGDKGVFKRFMKELRENYPYLITTGKRVS